MMLHHRVERRGGRPARSVDVPGAGPVGCTGRGVSVSVEALRRGRHGGACPRIRGAAMVERASERAGGEGLVRTLAAKTRADGV